MTELRVKPDPQLARLGANFVTLRAGEVVEATLMAESAKQVARLLELAPRLATLRLNFAGGMKPAAAKALFDVPGLRRLEEIELSGPSRDVWEAFFKSPHVRELKRLEIGAGHSVAFSRAPWPRLEALRIEIDGSAADRKALTCILAAELPRLSALALRAYRLGAAGAEVLARSPVYPQLRDLEIYDLEPALGDDGVAALAGRGQSLARLQLSLESVTPKGLTTLARLARGLQRLEITGCPVDEVRLRKIAKVEHVQVLKFRGAPSPDALATLLAATPELEELVLGSAAVGARHCDAIASAPLSQLRSLRIVESPIGAAGATALATLADLECLDLRSSAIGDGGAIALPRLRRLRELELQFCGIGDAGGGALAAWPRAGVLTTLNLNGNHILDKTVQDALTTRFALVNRVMLLGYQHPIRVEPVVAEMAAPKQRRQPPIPPRRRDWRAGLRGLVGRNHFASWDGHVDAKMIARSEALIDRSAEAILALGEDAEARAQRAVLKKCITSFNKLADHIFTIEAENIVETFEAIARYTKLAKEEDLADEWRDF